ncbi:MAG: bifunctional biotin--[acetyl-CoA-carboxylase] ligase/biotin operon repressor BirA [Halopseudomonas sp.]|uniref:bifunctional biotin--[acetyl-CoA-carboxylase] ligase/biotin operon repressor BirA n=1 Tax=Halopseudomonas sp. TaxID=2901191 RepID=UPI0030019519
MLHAILALLADGQFHSGEKLGEQLGVSRAAIWKALQPLEQQGFPLHRVRGKGYRIPQGAVLLDRAVVQAALPGALAERWQWHLYQQVDSTNAQAQRLVAETGVRPLVVIAEQQTAGRGRRGRQWSSPFGQNLYMSFVEPVSGGAQGLEGLSLVVGLTLVQALESCGYQGCRLKWPNDVLLDGAKLAGVLLEISGDLTADAVVVIGVGVNVLMEADDEIDQRWTSLRRCGQKGVLDRNQLIAAFASRLAESLVLFSREGFSAFHARWQDYDAWLGAEVQVISGDNVRTGRNLGVTRQGALRLLSEGGEVDVNGGEVSLRLSHAS